MIAKPAPIKTIPGNPTGWVYEICPRPADDSPSCPTAPGSPNYYGGTRLQLQPGDLLKVHLVNQLPLALDSRHAMDPGHEFLLLNPTNLHTHGLIVSPRGPSAEDPTYGDNIFVLTFNWANGEAAAIPHLHSDIRYNYTDYAIRIPPDHPSGIYVFHPHVHGLSLNQMSAGLSGLVAIGQPSDYLCKNLPCATLLSKVRIRHMLLKDTQLLPNGVLQTQEDPDFGAPAPDGDADDLRLGSVPGQDTTAQGGPDYTKGKWYFTLNGQPYPTIPITSAAGEIWRIANTSGSATYSLNLFNPAQGRNMIMQVTSSDGVSLGPSSDTTMGQLKEMGGAKFVPEACPAAAGPLATTPTVGLCTRSILMMPSSRVELWVSYRNTNDQISSPPAGSYAVFRSAGYSTGPGGDSWPFVNLAQVNFLSPVDIDTPALLGISGQAESVSHPNLLAADLANENKAAPSVPNCPALPPGHMRRVFFGVPSTNPNGFGLAYEEIDDKGNVVGQPATDLVPFDPTNDTICLPLGPGNTPVYERWQLVNLANELHNFHIHQTKFRVLTHDEVMGATLPNSPVGRGIEFDNIPLPYANGVCGSNPPVDPSDPITDWRAGLCLATPITVEIPFAAAGRFVYHCHILEHEDGGMMAVIQVVPSKQ